MKKLILTLTLIPSLLLSYEGMPEYLKDSVITVKTKDGKEYKFDGNHWKVVRRTKKEKTITFLVDVADPEKEGFDSRLEQANSELPPEKKNTVILSFGAGYNGISTQNKGSEYVVRENYVPVMGLTYCRQLRINDPLTPCATAITNETFMLGVKYGF